MGVLDVPSHGEIGAVDLQDQAGLRDGLVFLSHRFGDRVEIGLLARIMAIVEEQRDDARRGSAEKSFLCVYSSKGGAQIGDISFRSRGVAHADRTVAARCPTPRAAGIAEDPPGEFRKSDKILIDERVALAAKPIKPVLDIGRIARLAHLAVIDDVDAGLDLLFDN